MDACRGGVIDLRREAGVGHFDFAQRNRGRRCRVGGRKLSNHQKEAGPHLLAVLPGRQSFPIQNTSRMFIFSFSGTAVLLGLGGLCLAVGTSIFLLRRWLRQRSTLAERHAAFTFTRPLHRLSLCVALAAAFICLNWTQYEPQPTVYLVGGMEMDNLIEVDIPITKTPPPPPPPPPPPVIEPVAEPDVDTVVFQNMGLEPNEPVTATPPVLAPAPSAIGAPKPPPPPPPKEVIAPPIPFAERMPVYSNECFDLEDADRKMCSDRALLSFVQSRAYYPALARENGVEGTVVIAFTVEKDGTVTDIQAVRGVPAGCTEAALKAVRALQTEGEKFLPGRQGGLPVRVRFNLPVKFSLE